MPDRFGADVRSRIMSRVRGRDTEPERTLRSLLWAQGFRYRTHDGSVPGRPDISHKGRRVAVFVDGCFWHGCPKHYSRPASRQEFWDGKLQANVRRRRQVMKHLDAEGWWVVQAWECEVRENAARIATRVAKALRRKPTRREGGRRPVKLGAARGSRPGSIRGKSEACFRYKHEQCKKEGCPCPCHLRGLGLD